MFINEKAAESLEASVGDTLTMFLQSGTYDLNVEAIASDGGLAGDNETVLMSLPQAQAFFGHPGEVNSILVSNRGDERSGADLSEDVTEQLRSLLTNEEAATELKSLLGAPEVVAAIRDLAENQTGAMKDDLLETADLLESDGLDSKLVSNLADDGIGAQVLIAFESTTDDPAQLFAAFTLFSDLNILTVQDIKADLLNLASTLASGIMSIFIIFGLFSIMAGVMLIFLIFVMLAAERKPEMGIARAIGMKRGHLVQSFIYEGMAYDLISALVGALLGILVGMAMVSIMAAAFGDDNFELVMNYRWQSFVISYCLGVVLTFITVFFSSYRASKLNIVAAIRDLPDTLASTTQESKLRIVLRAIVAPFVDFGRAFRALAGLRVRSFLLNLLLGVVKLIPSDLGLAHTLVASTHLHRSFVEGLADARAWSCAGRNRPCGGPRGAFLHRYDDSGHRNWADAAVAVRQARLGRPTAEPSHRSGRAARSRVLARHRHRSESNHDHSPGHCGCRVRISQTGLSVQNDRRYGPGVSQRFHVHRLGFALVLGNPVRLAGVDHTRAGLEHRDVLRVRHLPGDGAGVGDGVQRRLDNRRNHRDIRQVLAPAAGAEDRCRLPAQLPTAYRLDARDARAGHIHTDRHVHAQHVVRNGAGRHRLGHGRLGHRRVSSATTTP